ncbi:MAG: hypothetical protein M1829_000619 [Trizodia sp. TS-e1964]|nr:MAG: hypothetical protein M1829_000619 [Trizodia sp. TS-e1964]
MSPPETLFLETTAKIHKDSMHSFMDFQVWDLPGQLDFLDPAFDIDSIFGEIGAFIWVIDAQDDYHEAIGRLNKTIIILQQSYPSIYIEIFIHKVDGLSEDFKLDVYRDVEQRINDELADCGFENPPLNYHLTSIYDHSIFEAFSKVIQRLIPQLPTLEALLNNLCANSQIERAYLFDVLSKIYIASDTSPSDISSYEICSDYIDVIVDASEIYGWDRPAKAKKISADDEGGENGHDESDDDGDEVGLEDSESVILLANQGKPLYLREINRYLALICVFKSEQTWKKRGLVDYNVSVFQDALSQVFDSNMR